MTDMPSAISPKEFRSLIALARRVIQGPAVTRRLIQAEGVTILPANFYSNIPLIDEVENSFENRFENGPYNLPSVFNATVMADFLDEIDKYADEFDPPSNGNIDAPECYFWHNPTFSWSDAMAYYCILRHFQPTCVVEIGSGFSTLAALQALSRNGSGELWCIEPFPRPWLVTLAGIKLVREPVQNLDPSFFSDRLTHEGDVLFIDSTHTVKAGGDCLQIYLRILPAICANILVQAHDIYLPFALPSEAALDKQLYWTEQYLLYAYLLNNPKARVLYGSVYNHKFDRDRLDRLMRGRNPAGGASLWFNLLAEPPSASQRA